MSSAASPGRVRLDPSRPPGWTVPPSARARRLRLVTLGALSVGGAALLLNAAGWVSFQFVIAFAGPGAIIVLLTAAAQARGEDGVLVQRLGVGLLGGLAGTAAYDLVRAGMLVTHIFGNSAFMAIPIFGSLMTGQPVSAPAAITAGWIYHVWNGIAFAGMYAIAAGRASWGYGVLFGMALEALYMGVIPPLARVSADPGFVAMSVAGHAVYGAVVGFVCQRRISE